VSEHKCEVCESDSEIIPFDCAGAGILFINVCRVCLDSEKFQEWLAIEFEKALATDPRWKRLPDGKWTKVKP